MNIWGDEMRDIRHLKKCFYHSPLPRKTQQVTAKCQRPGKVRILNEEETFLFKIRRYCEYKRLNIRTKRRNSL